MTTFSITTQYLEKKFNEFNKDFFFSKIPMVSFAYSKKYSILGTYIPKDHTIIISRAYDGKIGADVYEKVLIHEMVHAYLHTIGQTDTGAHRHHGRNFYREANRINSMTGNKYQISRTTNIGECRIKNIRTCSDFVVFVGKMRGMDIIGKVARKDSENIYGFMKSRCSVLDVYEPINGDVFPEFVTSYSRFNYKLASIDKYRDRLGKCITNKF